MPHLLSRLILSGGLLLAACPFAISAPPTHRPTRPHEASTVASNVHKATPRPKANKGSATHDGTGARAGSPVSFSSLAAKLRLKLDWKAGRNEVRLIGSGVVHEFELSSRECRINGRRVFLGEPVRLGRSGPWLSETDVQTLVIPLIKPGLSAPAKPRLRTILLDPGHGGADAGKINNRLKVNEKTFTLDTAKRLERLLEAKGYKVILTRKDDRFVALADRPALIEKHGADLFISIHFNSVASQADKVTGVEVFTLTPQWQLSCDQKPDKVFAPLKNPGNHHDYWNAALGGLVQDALLDRLGTPDRGLKRSRFAVLRTATCPAVLVEAGYLSHDGEARKISQASQRQKIAEALALAVERYSKLGRTR